MTSNTEIARLASITATERAMELNAETQAWVAANPGAWAGGLVEDAEFWAARGITTGLELARELLIGGFSDCFKEQNGIRPRWVSFEGLSFAECEALVERWLPTPTPEELEAREAEAAWERVQMAAEEAEWDARRAEAEEAREDVVWDALEARASRKSAARAARKAA